MPNRIPLLVIAVCLLLTVACKKSNHSGNSGPNPLLGSWTFAGETTNATVTYTASFGPISVKVVNLIDFRTIDNTGSFNFTSDSLDAIQVGYSIDTTYTSYAYTGLTIDTTVSPLTNTTPPANTSSNYELIGNDSIYFPHGSPFAVAADSVQPPIQINGAHFTISGNTLTLTSTINQSGNANLGGVTVPATGTGTSVITLTK
jgi:hypothetical protein